ncbi:MAG: flotillin-like FloA family protein, partial [Phycisphaerae bacterium]|nr:flotillin-like FloA family protein [Phycisphaerae bacterium]
MDAINLILAQNTGQFGWIVAIVIVLVALVVVFIVAQFFGLWLQAFMSNASVSLFDLIGMRLRKVDARVIVLCKIQAVKAGIAEITTSDLEQHYLAR